MNHLRNVLLGLMTLTVGTVTVVFYTPLIAPVPNPVAYRDCNIVAGKPHTTITLTERATLRDVVWEYAGAADCLDNGRMDGSTMPDCDVPLYLARHPDAQVFSDMVGKMYGTKLRDQLNASECVSAAVADDGRVIAGVSG